MVGTLRGASDECAGTLCIVAPNAIPLDTDPEIAEMLFESWCSMGVAGRGALAHQMCLDVASFARSGIVAQHPDFDEHQIVRELVRRRYGDALADEVYGSAGERGEESV